MNNSKKPQDVSEIIKIKKPQAQTCHNCNGEGSKNGKVCPNCGGEGKIRMV